MKILIDGFFFQLARSGIARVWRELIKEWSGISPDIELIFLDRGQSDLRISGAKCIPFQPLPIGTCFEEWSLRAWDEDRAELNKICNEIKPDIFMSTYFTYAEVVPNIAIVHDLIPENNSDTINLDEPIWKMKVQTIYAASGYVCVSYNTARELFRHFTIEGRNVLVAHNGANPAPVINPKDISEHKLGASSDIPFILIPGISSPGSYKNQEFIFRSLKSLISSKQLRVVITGENASTEIMAYEPYCNSQMIESGFLSEEELDYAYQNSLAVVYPSREEGFGLPIIEALARGALSITCMNSSLTEVGQSNAIYVNPDNELELLEIIQYLMKARELGINFCDPKFLRRQTQVFSWKHLAHRLDAFSRQVCLEKRHTDWMIRKGFNK